MTAPDRPLVHEGGVARRLGVFLVAFAFYLLLGDPADPFDLATGAATAAVAAAVLGRVVFEDPPTLSRTVPRALRAALFLPYLLYEVAKANVAVAAVVLRPSLPVDPAVVEVNVSGTTRFERAVLANALTLTPGTVAVRVTRDRLRVHALTDASRAALEEGGLQRAVAVVFHGRQR